MCFGSSVKTPAPPRTVIPAQAPEELSESERTKRDDRRRKARLIRGNQTNVTGGVLGPSNLTGTTLGGN